MPILNLLSITFNKDEGRLNFRNVLNRIFSRNGIAFELTEQGQIIRIPYEGLRQYIASSVFDTGDKILDNLLNIATIKFLDKQPDTRQESLEKLWDAWERLKTLKSNESIDKKQSIKTLISGVSKEDAIVNVLDEEAKKLTNIGNEFMIRHTEINKIPINDSELVDYLFHRLFALIMLLLRANSKQHDEKDEFEF